MTVLDPEKIPSHVAMIMDGNGRWATRQNRHRLEGHYRGAERVEELIRYSQTLGIRYLTLFAFSQENWQRPAEETQGLMVLLKNFLSAKTPELLELGVSLKVIGDLAQLPLDAMDVISASVEATRHCERTVLTLALSYSSRNEILKAMQRCFTETGQLPDQHQFPFYLDTAGVPDPDLLIRTSGECRLSNFLLWQLAYTELYFTETLWPDFGSDEFLAAILEYQRRERRFGRIADQNKTIV